MEIYDEMHQAIAIGQPYQTRLDPPPVDKRIAHEAAEAVASSMLIQTDPRTIVTSPARSESAGPEQTTPSNYGLYSCQGCGKIVLGYNKENLAHQEHRGDTPKYERL